MIARYRIGDVAEAAPARIVGVEELVGRSAHVLRIAEGQHRGGADVLDDPGGLVVLAAADRRG